jgi:N-acetylglutamate synthase-like GNAT family acetyltransferase
MTPINPSSYKQRIREMKQEILIKKSRNKMHRENYKPSTVQRRQKVKGKT